MFVKTEGSKHLKWKEKWVVVVLSWEIQHQGLSFLVIFLTAERGNRGNTCLRWRQQRNVAAEFSWTSCAIIWALLFLQDWSNRGLFFFFFFTYFVCFSSPLLPPCILKDQQNRTEFRQLLDVFCLKKFYYRFLHSGEGKSTICFWVL